MERSFDYAQDKPHVTPREWMHGWIGMLDQRRPGWRVEYDAEAFELAAADLFGEAMEPAFGPVDLDILGEFALEAPEEAAGVCRKEIQASDRFRRAMSDFESLFRASQGSSRASPPLREARARALGQVVDVLMGPIARRLNRLGHAMDMRDFRSERRTVALSGDAAAGGSPPVELMAREAAERVAERAREELSARALAAARSLFLDPGDEPAREVAARAGISPATLTRALQRLREISAEELKGCPESILGPFASALFERLAE